LAKHNLVDIKDVRARAGFPHEQNDCTVLALSVAFGVSYSRAHELVKAGTGRKDRHGPSGYLFQKFMEVQGFKEHINPVHCKCGNLRNTMVRQTFKQWIKLHPCGTYIVDVEGHVFAVVAGVVHDVGPVGSRKRIHGHWRIT